MSDEPAFLQAVMASPDDDGPRLRYADWLAETGAPADAARAELIRVQTALERLPEDDPSRAELARRSQRLLSAHGDDWAAPVLEAAGWQRRVGNRWRDRIARRLLGPWQRMPGTMTYCAFHRGFVEEVHHPTATFPDWAAALFRATPLSRLELNYEGEPADLELLLSLPELSRLRHLGLPVCRIGPELAAPITGCPGLAGLRGLDLSFNHQLGDAGIGLLANSPHLANLETLNLELTGCGPDGARALAESPYLTRLRSLDLSENQPGAEGAAALAAAPGLAGLRWLDLSGTDVGNAGALAIAESPYLRNLTYLGLHNASVGRAGSRALAARFPPGRVIHW